MKCASEGIVIHLLDEERGSKSISNFIILYLKFDYIRSMKYSRNFICGACWLHSLQIVFISNSKNALCMRYFKNYVIRLENFRLSFDVDNLHQLTFDVNDSIASRKMCFN